MVDAAGRTVSPPHVAICFLSRGICHSGFAFDLANLVGYATATLVQLGMDLHLTCYTTTYVQTGRSECMREVLKDPKVTHILWLDDDMRFPKIALQNLLERNQSIVGCNYASRLPPYRPIAITSQAEDTPCVTSEDATGLEPVEVLGFGCVLVRREVFDTLAYPWFDTPYRAEGQYWTGDDVYFCEQARQAGYTLYVDHDLSKHVKHCGTFEFSLDHANVWMQAEEERSHVA